MSITTSDTTEKRMNAIEKIVSEYLEQRTFMTAEELKTAISALGFSYLGSGSTRFVFLKGNKVLKIPKYNEAKVMNLREAEKANTYAHLVPKMYEYSKTGLYIISEFIPFSRDSKEGLSSRDFDLTGGEEFMYKLLSFYSYDSCWFNHAKDKNGNWKIIDYEDLQLDLHINCPFEETYIYKNTCPLKEHK